MSIAAVSNQALEDASEWLGQVFGRTAGTGLRHGLNATVSDPAAKCAGCGGD